MTRPNNTDKADDFLAYWYMLAPKELGMPEAEYHFFPLRKWRFDWAFPKSKIAVEVEGNAWAVKGGGRHMTDTDMEKYNRAASLGWRLFRFSPGMLRRDPKECIELVVMTISEAVTQ